VDPSLRILADEWRIHADALAQITWFLAGLLEKCRK